MVAAGDADLINAVAWTMSNKLDLPFPVGTKAYIYVNQATFVDGLIQIAGEEHEQAWDKGRFAALARAELFAHELTHVSQHTLVLLGLRQFLEARDEIDRTIISSK